MTATTRSAEGTTLMLAFDLGSTTWTLGFTTAPAQRPRMRTMPAGDLGTLVTELQLAKARFGLPLDASVPSCDEAGRDGFWLHRWLLAHAVDNVVVDSASIEVNRRARRAKTDRLDVSKLLALRLFKTSYNTYRQAQTRPRLSIARKTVPSVMPAGEWYLSRGLRLE